VSCIDCGTDSVIKVFNVSNPYAICFYPPYNRVMCSRVVLGGRIWYLLGITAIDCANNSVVADFDLANLGGLFDRRLEFGYNAYNCVVYCRAAGGGVFVCAGTDIVQTFGTQGYGGGFAWNRRQNRMYAACEDDSRIAVLRDVGGGVAEGQTSKQQLGFHQGITIVRGALFLPEVSDIKREASSSLLDISGRKVLDLHPGANDVRALSPGVYFVREAYAQAQSKAVRKVVLMR